VAELERGLIVERVNTGLRNARAKGKRSDDRICRTIGNTCQISVVSTSKARQARQ
jgi:DNA invertase Pin-like site-specific DNA recombinase